MNANELADDWDKFPLIENAKETATMLRTIPALEAEIENLNRINRHEHIVAENALKEIDEWKYISQRLESVIKNKEVEIEALKISLSGNSAQILSKNDKTLPNGKLYPVACMVDGEVYLIDEIDAEEAEKFNAVPLYTHQVKTLDISRNEALAVWDKEFGRKPITTDYIPAFARAILRKAQEK